MQVRRKNRKIKEPATVSDLSLHLQALTEPFLCFREIDLHVRNGIESKFSSVDQSILAETPITARKPQGIADLNFGEYVLLFQIPRHGKRCSCRSTKVSLQSFLKRYA